MSTLVAPTTLPGPPRSRRRADTRRGQDVRHPHSRRDDTRPLLGRLQDISSAFVQVESLLAGDDAQHASSREDRPHKQA